MSKDNKEHAQILADAKAFRDEAQSYWQDTFDRGREDKEFITIKGKQWDDNAIAARKAADKPTLEFNLLGTFASQQINTMRQNRPQISVIPVDDGADTEVAKILGGLIKDTEEASNAEDANDQAADNAVKCGLGFIRIITDYVDDKSFNQEPRFVPIENPEAVLFDPFSRRLDGSDASKCLVAEWVNKDQIKEQYGKDATDFDVDGASEWHNQPKNTVLIAEYFYKVDVQDELLLLSDGTTEYKSVMLEQWDELDLQEFVADSRPSKRTEVRWAKLSGCKVLETGVFPSKYIPIVPVYGAVTWISNDRHVFSLIHFAKDPQRLFNYWKSAEANILQKNQDDMLVAAAEGVAGYEDQWRDPSRHAAVYYNHKDGSGNPIPMPQRIGSAQPPTGILNATATSQQLISDTLNMHAPQMGQQINNQSGKAISLLQGQGDTAHFHFQDNLNKSLRQCGRILIDLYPKLYDTPMVRRIIGADGEEEMVKLNAQPQTPDEQQKAIDGIINNLSIGRYDVRIDTGPSFNTQREQSFQLMMQIFQFAPDLMQVAGDLAVKDSPLINAKEIAERLKKRMDPALLEDGKGMHPAVQAQMTQMQQQAQMLQQQLQQAQAQINDKNADREVQIQKSIIDAEKAVQVAQIGAASRTDVEELRNAFKMLEQQMSLLLAPPEWLQQGEDVNSYNPNISQTGDFEPPPNPAHQPFPNPAIEQGFLMPGENAQPNFAPESDQFGESAQIENGMNFMPNGDGQNDV